MPLRILLSGFKKFGGLGGNPSEDAVRRIAADPPHGVAIETIVLPVEYGRAFEPVRSALESGRVDVAVHLGVAATRTAVEVERFALNWRGGAQADEAGIVLAGERIDARGPTALESTLPVEALAAAIRRTGVAAQVSSHAGTFLCNQFRYQTLRHAQIRKLGVRAAFIHLPLPAPDGHPGDLAAITAGVVAALREATEPEPGDRSIRTRRSRAR
ncbi:MAG: pyroglutamyl-peptidase I [Planctomycetes bacterium]|nr:pyroglutamyl-peptidase I [Planctomycetota bacterium]